MIAQVSVAWSPSSGQAVPRDHRGQLPWIAWGLVATWSLITVVVAIYSALNAKLDGSLIGGPAHFGLQAREGIGLLLAVVWFMSFNLAFAGLVIGVVSTARGATGRLWRSAVLTTLVVVGGVAEIWGLTAGAGDASGASGYAIDARLHMAVPCVVALLVMVGAGALLRLRPAGDR